MDIETKNIIADQTGQTDLIIIEKIFFECNGDVGACVLKLLNISYDEKHKQPYTKFDEIRTILDEKEKIYQNIMDKQKHGK